MKWILIALGFLALVVLVTLIAGLLQSAKHSVTRSIDLKQTPEAVFSALDHPDDLPAWSSTVLKVERLPDSNGKPAARLTLAWGHMRMITTQLERTAPRRLVTSMAKEGGPVLGTWTYEITPKDGGCRVVLTETGEITNPFFRVLARLRGLDANITQTLRDLARKFGETPFVS